MFLRTYKFVRVFKYQVNKHSYMRTNFHKYVLTRTHICSFYTCIIEHTLTIRTNIRKICCKNRTYVFLRTHYMSVYSYVELKVHTNVRKSRTHLNICLAYRTYVRWKYTFMFAYKKKRSIYLYIMNICLGVGTRTLSLPRPFPPFSFLSIILYLYTEMRTLFPAPYLSRHLSYPFFVYPYILFYYILYI